MFSLLSPTTCIKPGYRLLSNQTFAYNFPDYQPRPPWFGADLQTLYNKIAQPQTNLSQYLNSRLLLPLNDDSGDALVGRLFLPDTPTTTAFTRPLIVLVHGLGGSAQSIYMRVAAEHFLTNNYPVLKVNLRGVAESGPYCGEHNHPGCSDDLHLLLEGLITQVKPNLLVQGVVLMGFSLGGNIVLKFLGEQPKHPLVWAGITVSAPLDLAATSEALLEWRNAGYQRYLLRRIWANSLRPTMEISPLEREALANANSVWEVDAMFTAP